MRDMIDERDYRERSSRSIVKGYNVHYMTPEELAEQERQKNQAEPEKVSVPKDEPEEEVQPKEQEEVSESQENVTQEQIAKILGEREEQYNQMLKEIKQQ